MGQLRINFLPITTYVKPEIGYDSSGNYTTNH